MEYTWERKNAKNEWIYIDVPIDTCLLYAKCVGVYKCEVARREFTFEVKGTLMYNHVATMYVGTMIIQMTLTWRRMLSRSVMVIAMLQGTL